MRRGKCNGICAGMLLVTLLLTLLFAAPGQVRAAGDLDRIENYEITADVNEDATVTLHYHIEWRVLDSDSEGPLSWVTVGIPNPNYISCEPKSDTITSISDESGSTLRIDLDREYYEGEVAVFDFEVVQDYLYEMNWETEGETVYQLTPGWFDSLKVDRFALRWNADQVKSWDPSCKQIDGYLTWEQPLDYGESVTVQVTYPNGAFAFDETKSIVNGGDDSSYTDSDLGFGIATILPIMSSPQFKFYAGLTDLYPS